MLIPKAIYKAMTRICSREKTRYALDGVEFACDKGTATARATNGRSLLSVRWPSTHKAEPFIRPAKEIKSAKLGYSTRPVEIIEAMHPDYKDTPMPEFTSVTPVHASHESIQIPVDAKLLSELLAAMAAISDVDSHRVTMSIERGQPTPGQCVPIKFMGQGTAGSDQCGVIMSLCVR